MNLWQHFIALMNTPRMQLTAWDELQIYLYIFIPLLCVVLPVMTYAIRRAERPRK